MIQVIFSLDYEIHGNGDGSPYKLMVKPVNRILKLFSKYGAKLTIFADAAEILKFKEYYELTGIDRFYYLKIVKQLKNAVKAGHDVQLHIHSSYLNAKLVNGKWLQDWREYNLAELPVERIDEIIKLCKEYLEGLLKPVNGNYCCNVFRAANWSMMPTQNIVNALIKNGFKIDSSVYKFGKSSGRVNFDYSSAESNVQPWLIDSSDINKSDKHGRLVEVPIYCEKKSFIYFVTPIRIFRYIRAKVHKHKKFIDENRKAGLNQNKIKRIFQYFKNEYPWKLDFNQATGRQLTTACGRIEIKYNSDGIKLPLVLTGHSKTFVKINSFLIKPFLKYISDNKNYEFALYSDIKIKSENGITAN